MAFAVKEKGGFKLIDEGEGEPLILLHGLFGGLAIFPKITEQSFQYFHFTTCLLEKQP